ncbi:hypothetical protein ACFLU6_12695 [Acidobacteriota bacterium]
MIQKYRLRFMARLKPFELWLLVFFVTLCSFALPFMLERNDERWARTTTRIEQKGGSIIPPEPVLQLNIDQLEWIDLAADFPHAYMNPELQGRMARPVYPAMVSTASRLYQGITELPGAGFSAFIGPCSPLEAYRSAVIINWLVLMLSVFGFYHLLQRWRFNHATALLAAAHLALTMNVLFTLPVITPDLSVLGIVVAALWLFSACSRHGGREIHPLGAIVCGLLMGLLLMVKQHYDVMATVWILLLLTKRWRTAGITFIAHFLPHACWVGILRLMGLAYTSREVDDYGQGTWIIEEFLFLPSKHKLVTLWDFTLDYLHGLHLLYGPVILLAAAIGIIALLRKRAFDWIIVAFAGIVMNGTLTFAINLGASSRFILSSFFIIYPLAAIGVEGLCARLGSPVRKKVLLLYLVLATAMVWIRIFHLPIFTVVWPSL